MAHLHLVLNIPDLDPATEDPEEVADRLIDWDHVQWRGPDAPEVAGARWPLTRGQLAERLFQTMPGVGRHIGENTVVDCTVRDILDAVEALLNPPWEA